MAKYKNSQIYANPVAEGVRFRIGSATAFAVRNGSKDIAVRLRREYRPMRARLEKIPFLRGILRLFLIVIYFLDGIYESAELEPQRIVRGTRFERKFANLFRIHPMSLVAFGSGLLIPILLIGLILGLPLAVESLITAWPALSRGAINAIVCTVRVLGTLLAVVLIVQLRVMNRLGMYQGAINKVLNGYLEAGSNVTQETAMRSSHISRKCDMAFFMLVVVLSIIAFSLVRIYTLPVQIIGRLLIVLVIAAIVNEPFHVLEDASEESAFAALLTPAMAFEQLFVREPHSQMVEVALCAFKAARENDIAL